MTENQTSETVQLLDKFISDGRCPNCFEQNKSLYPCPHCRWIGKLTQETGVYLSPGTILINKYMIGRVLGHGGFGITYLGWDMKLDIRLAVKEYLPRDMATRSKNRKTISPYTGPSKEEFEYGLEKFLDEARALAKFEDNQGIVSIRDFFLENGTAYFVMYFINGVTLKDYLGHKGTKISFPIALKMLMPVFDALGEVHRSGLLHLDISPDNILITDDGRIKILDFGSARYATGEHSRSLSVILNPGYAPEKQYRSRGKKGCWTDIYALCATFYHTIRAKITGEHSRNLSVTLNPGYAPEEQYRSRGKEGPWTDIYALCATFYRAITGVTPPKSLDRFAGESLEPPSRLGVDISPKAEMALLKGLSMRIPHRYHSIEALKADILSQSPMEPELSLPQGISPEPYPDPDMESPPVPEPQIKRVPHPKSGLLREHDSVKPISDPSPAKKQKSTLILISGMVIAFLIAGGLLFPFSMTDNSSTTKATIVQQADVTSRDISKPVEEKKKEHEKAKPEIVHGSIKIESIPSGSTVYIDDIKVGITPITLENLTQGHLSLRVEKSEYKKWLDKVFIQAGQSSSFTVELEKLAKYLRHGDRIKNNLGMEFVYIAPTSFYMGSPSDEPHRDSDEIRHRVELTKGYYIQTTEVTQGQWKAVMGSNPSYFKNCGSNCPVESVSWDDIQTYTQKLNQRDGKKYRLPTEAEWECAARAGTDTPFAFGTCLGTDQANYDGNHPMSGCSKGVNREKNVAVVAVKSFSPNAWGLYDMHGNVREWCQDWYGAYSKGNVTDPAGPSSRSHRVVRGGGWPYHAMFCRSAFRGNSPPGSRYGDLGFRLVQFEE
ncbi:MAG: SUMF1/EgtB/PvdO family nonheme iron enzyme [Desulfamplus sp.]|nr:SUMF1/EgtB/PvdO family nonheme iron enzyme [Desulfamplus sp.]